MAIRFAASKPMIGQSSQPWLSSAAPPTPAPLATRLAGNARLRVCPRTSCRIGELSQHEADGSETQEGERLAVEVLPILGQPAASAEPGKRALHDPSLGQDDKPLRLIGAL